MAQIHPHHEITMLDIGLPLKWRVQPGQYVQLWAPRGGLRATFQLPSFVVAYWRDHDDRRTIYLLFRPGIWRLLARLSEKNHKSSISIIAVGPHGYSYDFRSFGTVLLIANDIGIAGILPYIKALVEASKRRNAMVRKLEIVWQMEDFGECAFLSPGRNLLLTADFGTSS